MRLCSARFAVRYFAIGCISLLFFFVSVGSASASTTTFGYSGGNQYFTVPSGVTSLQIQLWGAGGGAAGSGSTPLGGAGGFTSGVISVAPGQVLTVIVGEAGTHAGVAGYGGGGAAGTTGGSWRGGSGGGRSAVKNGSNELIVAGGGGGGGDTGIGGAGGGSSGTAGGLGTNGGSGGGGSQNSGGTAQSSGPAGADATAGFSDTGGSGNTVNNAGGGGGGGGYYGGGGGGGPTGDGGGGGGGSGYCGGSGVSGCTTSTGSGAGAGGNGQITIIWTAIPAATCTATLTPASIAQGGSSTLTWSSSNASTMYLNNVGYVQSSGSATVSPSATTDYSGTAAGSGGTGTCPASLAVTPAPSCSVSFDQNPITQGNGTNIHWSSANAATMTLKSIGSVSPNTSGSAWVQPSQTSDYSCTATGPGGATATQSASLTVQCTVAYTCSGNTIVQMSSSCVQSTIASCVSPQFCSIGSSICLNPSPSFNATSNGGQSLTGHLQARPEMVRTGTTATLYWNVSNVASCSVSGTDGDAWTGASSGSSGQITGIIAGPTVYTLACTSLSGVSPPSFSETTTINVVPVFEEK